MRRSEGGTRGAPNSEHRWALLDLRGRDDPGRRGRTMTRYVNDTIKPFLLTCPQTSVPSLIQKYLRSVKIFIRTFKLQLLLRKLYVQI